MRREVRPGSLQAAEDAFLLDRFGTAVLERSLSLCLSCSFIFQNPTYSRRDLERIYGVQRTNICDLYMQAGYSPSDLWDSAEARRTERQRRSHYTDWLLRQKPQRILDYGGNKGQNIASPLLAGTTRYLYDFENTQGEGNGIQTVADPSACRDIDAILHTHVLEHEPDPQNGLMCLRRCVSPRGRLLLEVPFDYFERLLSHRPGAIWHVNHFNRSTLRRLLARAGWVWESIAVEHRPYQNGFQVCLVAECRPRGAANRDVRNIWMMQWVVDLAVWLRRRFCV